MFIAQSLGSAALITGATVISIVGADLSGSAALAGVPSAVLQMAAAISALGWGYLSDVLGRRGGLALGLVLGVVGSFMAAEALIGRSWLFFLLGMLLVGAARSALQLSRFAAAEVHVTSERGRAISNVVIGGTVGAIFGPLLVGPTGSWSLAYGLPELFGPFAAGLALFALAAGVVFLGLRPDPRDVGKEVARLSSETGRSLEKARPLQRILSQPAVIVAVVAMVVSQMVMVMLMVITALHMSDHQHGLRDISVVISSHTLGMYAFSIFSGRLTDRWGREPVILTGALTLLLACLVAPLSTAVLPLSVSLFLLGLGWNFCYVGGSSLLSDQLSPAERGRIQGFNDLLIGLASAAGSFGSGLVFAALGFGAMGIVGAVSALIPLGLTLWWQMGARRLALSK